MSSTCDHPSDELTVEILATAPRLTLPRDIETVGWVVVAKVLEVAGVSRGSSGGWSCRRGR
jgi:hypothetical protein